MRGSARRAGDWRVWLILAGRGFGKTRAGAEWVSGMRGACRRRGSLWSAPTLDDVATGDGRGAERAAGGGAERRGGALGARAGGEVTFRVGRGGASSYSAERPEKLRGPEHDFAWCDELGKWAHGEATWDNLMLGLRRGDEPRAVVTTTPRPAPLMRGSARWPGLRRDARADGGQSASAAQLRGGDAADMAGRGSGGRSWTAS